jgi:hypothetical protein
MVVAEGLSGLLCQPRERCRVLQAPEASSWLARNRQRRPEVEVSTTELQVLLLPYVIETAERGY